MNRSKLEKLKRELAAARLSAQKPRDLEKLAGKLGRKKADGKHPMWISEDFHLMPLAIPHHGGLDFPPGTRNSILNQLDDDICAWEDYLGEQEGNE